MKSEEAERLKALEDENRRLKELVADLTLDNKNLRISRRETGEPRPEASGGGRASDEVRHLRAQGLQSNRPAAQQSAIQGEAANRRGTAREADAPVGSFSAEVRLSTATPRASTVDSVTSAWPWRSSTASATPGRLRQPGRTTTTTGGLTALSVSKPRPGSPPRVRHPPRPRPRLLPHTRLFAWVSPNPEPSHHLVQEIQAGQFTIESVTFTSGRDRSTTVPAPRYLKVSSVTAAVELGFVAARLVGRFMAASMPTEA